MTIRQAITLVTGAQYTISAGAYEATVTELGAGIRELRHRGQPLLDGYEPDELPPGAAGQLLLPWPNRVDHGRYALDGASYQLDLSEPAADNAIHGLTRWSPWSLAQHDGTSVSLGLALLGRAGYPFCLDIEASYRLDPDLGLRCDVTARNAGSRPAPYGTGHHPYLSLSAPVDSYTLTLPAAHWLPAGERSIPTGEAPRDVEGTDLDFRAGRVVGTATLDHTFTQLARDGDGRAWASIAADGRQVSLWSGPGYGWLQVFTGDTLAPARRRRGLAVEPMTCPPNAFVTGTDLLMLAPGDAVTHSWGILAATPSAAG